MVFAEHGGYRVGGGGMGGATFTGEVLDESDAGVGGEEGGMCASAVSLSVKPAADGGTRGLV